MIPPRLESFYPELPSADFRPANAARTLGYSWGDVQDLHTLRIKEGVRVLGFTRATGLPFTPPGEWIALMADVPEGGPMWFHQSESVVAYCAEQSDPHHASTGDRLAVFRLT